MPFRREGGPDRRPSARARSNPPPFGDGGEVPTREAHRAGQPDVPLALAGVGVAGAQDPADARRVGRVLAEALDVGTPVGDDPRGKGVPAPLLRLEREVGRVLELEGVDDVRPQLPHEPREQVRAQPRQQAVGGLLSQGKAARRVRDGQAAFPDCRVRAGPQEAVEGDTAEVRIGAARRGAREDVDVPLVDRQLGHPAGRVDALGHGDEEDLHRACSMGSVEVGEEVVEGPGTEPAQAHPRRRGLELTAPGRPVADPERGERVGVPPEEEAREILDSPRCHGILHRGPRHLHGLPQDSALPRPRPR